MAVAQREAETRGSLIGVVRNLKNRATSLIGRSEPHLTSDEFTREVIIDTTRDQLVSKLTQCGTKVKNQVLVGMGNEHGIATIARGSLGENGKVDDLAPIVIEYPYVPNLQLLFGGRRGRFCAVLPEYKQQEADMTNSTHEPFFVVSTEDGQEQIVPHITTDTLESLAKLFDRYWLPWTISKEAAADFLDNYTNFDEQDLRYQLAQSEKLNHEYENQVLSFLRRIHLNSPPQPSEEGYWNDPR